MEEDFVVVDWGGSFVTFNVVSAGSVVCAEPEMDANGLSSIMVARSFNEVLTSQRKRVG